MAEYPYDSSHTRINNLAQVQKFYVRNLLDNGKAWLVHYFPLQTYKMESKKDKTAVFKRYAAFSLATTPITEGVTPAGQSMSASQVTATLLQFGDFTTVTDVADWASEDPTITVATDLLASQYGETLESYAASVLSAGSNVILANNVSAVNLIDSALTSAELRQARRALMSAKGKFFNPLIGGSNRIGTQPIGPSYWAVTNTDCLVSLEKIDGFVPVHQYPDPKSAAQYEAGYVNNIRFLLTQYGTVELDAGNTIGSEPLISHNGVNADIYSTLVFAENAAGTVRADALSADVIVCPIGSAGAADPLRQRGTVAWKAMQVVKILNDNWLVNIKSAAYV